MGLGGGEDSSEKAKIKQMKPGDYLVHVHVQTAKNLKLEGEDTVNPFVKVVVCGKEQRTTTKEGISYESKLVINEHLFVDLPNLTKDEVENSQINIKVENRSYFSGDTIGEFEISTQKIYNMKEHTMLNQRLGLNNPNSEDFSKITGYVTVSINVVGPGDESVELTQATEAVIAEKPPLIPTSIKKVYKQLYLRLLIAEDLPKMDKYLGTIDAYALLQIGKNKLKTKVYTMKDQLVEWNQEMLIPVEMPIKDDSLILKIYD